MSNDARNDRRIYGSEADPEREHNRQSQPRPSFGVTDASASHRESYGEAGQISSAGATPIQESHPRCTWVFQVDEESIQCMNRVHDNSVAHLIVKRVNVEHLAIKALINRLEERNTRRLSAVTANVMGSSESTSRDQLLGAIVRADLLFEVIQMLKEQIR